MGAHVALDDDRDTTCDAVLVDLNDAVEQALETDFLEHGDHELRRVLDADLQGQEQLQPRLEHSLVL